jgi:hypothetical protein
MRVERVSQEFYCGECKGYFIIRLRLDYTGKLMVECPLPSCRHQHTRFAKDGVIQEDGRDVSGTNQEVIVSNMATYAKSPLTKEMQDAEKKKAYMGRRDAVPVNKRSALWERWQVVALREQGLLGDD